jgi:hypothetical protein
MDKQTIDVLSALLVPLIAIVTTYVAVQQYRLARQRLKHDLYPDRIRVYRTVMEFLAHVAQHASVSNDELSRLITQTSECNFLFRGKIGKHIDELYKRAIDLQYVNTSLRDDRLPIGPDRDALADQLGEHLGWFRKQFDITRDLFDRYLSFRIP